MAPSLNVLAIGGLHQLAHFLPVACEIHRRGECRVLIFAPTQSDISAIRKLASKLHLLVPPVVEMKLPVPMARILSPKAHKLARILLWANKLRAADAILTAERTSTILKRIPGKCPPLIHIPHGAGDRAAGFERRFRLLDEVLVAGPKDKDRLVEMGLVRSDRIEVVGPVKVSAILRQAGDRPALFDNDRPVVLYNPHFEPGLRSFDAVARPVVDVIVQDGRYNLIVAPHVRLAEHWGERQSAKWEALAVPGRVIVDLGSERSCDMTYTLAADLYLGDVSSQVYEFLVKPRPCVFVNAHAIQYQGDENYAMWRLGEVVGPNCDEILRAIDRAFDSHRHYRKQQEQRVRYALGGVDWRADGSIRFLGSEPVTTAASMIEACMGVALHGDQAHLAWPRARSPRRAHSL